MVMGVNHVNLSTNLKNPAANVNARVSYPVTKLIFQGPRPGLRSSSRQRFLAGGSAFEGLGAVPHKNRVTRVTRVTCVT